MHSYKLICILFYFYISHKLVYSSPTKNGSARTRSGDEEGGGSQGEGSATRSTYNTYISINIISGNPENIKHEPFKDGSLHVSKYYTLSPSFITQIFEARTSIWAAQSNNELGFNAVYHFIKSGFPQVIKVTNKDGDKNPVCIRKENDTDPWTVISLNKLEMIVDLMRNSEIRMFNTRHDKRGPFYTAESSSLSQLAKFVFTPLSKIVVNKIVEDEKVIWDNRFIDYQVISITAYYNLIAVHQISIRVKDPDNKINSIYLFNDHIGCLWYSCPENFFNQRLESIRIHTGMLFDISNPSMNIDQFDVKSIKGEKYTINSYVPKTNLQLLCLMDGLFIIWGDTTGGHCVYLSVYLINNKPIFLDLRIRKDGNVNHLYIVKDSLRWSLVTYDFFIKKLEDIDNDGNFNPRIYSISRYDEHFISNLLQDEIERDGFLYYSTFKFLFLFVVLVYNVPFY